MHFQSWARVIFSQPCCSYGVFVAILNMVDMLSIASVCFSMVFHIFIWFCSALIMFVHMWFSLVLEGFLNLLCLKLDFEVDCVWFCSFVYIAFHGLGWFSLVGIWFVMILLSLGRSVSFEMFCEVYCLMYCSLLIALAWCTYIASKCTSSQENAEFPIIWHGFAVIFVLSYRIDCRVWHM